MKVTVCFGSVRVLVPCGAGDLLVRDLVREATLRYKKATGQGPETWVGVRALRDGSGGILDPDDRVRDVADDRETLTAECTNQSQPRAAQADGASGSSAGTASPDMFRGGGGVGGSMRVPNSDSCVEVSAAELEDGASGLQVRRGSEPTLHQDTHPHHIQVSDPTKRWSAAVVCREDNNRLPPPLPALPSPPSPAGPPGTSPPRAPHFQRQTNRLSMQFSGPGSGMWLDAAEKVQSYGTKSLPRDARREPLGQDTPTVNNNNNHQTHRVEDMLRWVSGVHASQERQLDHLPEASADRVISNMEVPVSPSKKPQSGSSQTIPVTLVKGERGLGFTITTRDNPTGGHCPIYIKTILPKGAAVSDGRLRAGDKLVSINGVSVHGLHQQDVVALLRNTPTDAAVDMVVERPGGRTQRVEPQQSPTKYTEKAIGSPNGLSQSKPESIAENGRVSSIVNAINNNSTSSNHSNGSMRGKLQKSASKDDLVNKEEGTTQDVLNSSNNSILSARNRLILRLDVPVHDSEKAGLGISVKGKVTVGNDAQDLGIFIKSVLNGGAASRDGRLHKNDQLLSVNGVSLVGQSNAEAMETLRRALLHSRPFVHGSISLTIARRSESMDSLSRWKDDTPPNGDDSTNLTNSTDSNANYNTVIYNDAKHNYQNVEINKNVDITESRNKKHASIVTINNNNSWVSNQSDDSKGYLEKDSSRDSKRDSFEWSRLDGGNPVIDRLTGLRNESYYMATQEVTGNGQFRANPGHVHMLRPPQHHVIIEEDYGTTKAATAPGTESGSESGGGFDRRAVGRQSMSEKRHAAMDAKLTGTYRKIKENKQQVEVGPALGMRKSSSLESLQTAMLDQRPREALYARPHPPMKHWLTDGGAASLRGSPQHSSLSHKKPSLLKSLSTMFRIGKPSKKEPEIYGRTAAGRASEKSLSREAIDKHNRDERHEEQNHKQQDRPEIHHSRQSSGERSSRSERDRRRGERDRDTAPAPPYRAPPDRAPTHHQMESAWGPAGHYVNYDEIQQNLNSLPSLRREKLSEVQMQQMRRQVSAQRAKAEQESRRAGTAGFHSQRSCRDPTVHAARPQSNYYEYESAPPRRPGKLSHYH